MRTNMIFDTNGSRRCLTWSVVSVSMEGVRHNEWRANVSGCARRSQLRARHLCVRYPVLQGVLRVWVMET